MDKLNATRECPNCGYDCQLLSLRKCEVCEYDFGLVKKKKARKELNKGRKSNKLEIRKKIKYSLILIGIMVISFSFLYLKQEKDNFKIIGKVPTGVFNFGGDPEIISSIDRSFQSEIQKEYPDFKLRQSKALESENFVEKLIQGEISFIIHYQPLKDRDYEKGRLRGYQLKQLPLIIEELSSSNKRIFFSYREDATIEARAAKIYYDILTSEKGEKMIKSIKLKSFL